MTIKNKKCRVCACEGLDAGKQEIIDITGVCPQCRVMYPGRAQDELRKHVLEYMAKMTPEQRLANQLAAQQIKDEKKVPAKA